MFEERFSLTLTDGIGPRSECAPRLPSELDSASSGLLSDAIISFIGRFEPVETTR